ncbi:two-component system regulatory protein YycI [Caldicellulosiruptor naganoensis]|uniref:Two-component system regulatory protein YycI n=1 Tax=Caldicellulosiruptor naganoensis TaxID=29324 RepID=A0ABY7BHI4_9FIRM|nr:two-component system regulatory protein YycI [Caldicellulosiruptor naganoensis]WAM31511.1 two-component system regulatory protein YycI [Caldicellulosiruptor naganoensis]
MNWSKVKTIAIGVFSVLVLFLVVKYLNLLPKEEFLSDKQIQTAQNILAQNSIKLSCAIDKRIYYVSKLNVKTESAYDSILTKLFGKRVDKYQNEFESSIYHLKIINQTLFLESKYNQDPFELFDLNKSDYIKDYDGSYIQVYKGYPIFDSKLKIQKQNDKILYIFTKVIPQGFEIKRNRAISALEAIFNLLNQQKNVKEIQNIKFGFYLKDFNVIQGQAVPVWRIVADGEVYYINGFTGMLE